MNGERNDSFYRISLKAIIRNDKGEVLVVKEDSDAWSLPGGGMDHGEDLMVALARELHEEVAFTGNFTAKLVAAEPMYLKSLRFWQMWLVYEVETDADTYEKGADADEIAFMNPEIFKNSSKQTELLVYKYCQIEKLP